MCLMKYKLLACSKWIFSLHVEVYMYTDACYPIYLTFKNIPILIFLQTNISQ